MSEAPQSWTRFIQPTVRTIFGLALVAFGLMHFFVTMQPPADLPEAAKAFNAGLEASGYMMPLIACTLLVSGVLLVANIFAPLALLLLAPFWVNSFLFHLFLEPTGLAPSGIFVALELYLAWTYRSTFAAVLKLKNTVG